MLTQEVRYSYGANGFGNWLGTATFRNMPTDAERIKARRVIRAHIITELAERERNFAPSSVRLSASGAGPFMGGWSLTWTERD